MINPELLILRDALPCGDHSREHQPVGPMADRLQILMTAQRLNGRGGGEQPRPGGSVQRDT